MILADFGAEVLRLRAPGRPEPEMPAAATFQRGKSTLELDVHADREALHELCALADVLVLDWQPSKLAAYGLTPAALRERHPHLVVCAISGFGDVAPWNGLPGYEHLVAAVAGRMNVFSGCADRDGPVFPALYVATHAAAQSAVSGILAATLQPSVGRLVEVSLLQGLLAYEQGAMIGAQFKDRLGELADKLPSAPREAPMPTLHYHPAQAADGWLQFGNLLPHLFDNFLVACELLDILADPEFDSAQLVLPPEKMATFRARLLGRIQERTVAEWMATFVENGSVVATEIRTTQAALDDPDLIDNGHVLRREGRRELGPLARLSETPAEPGRAVPDGGALRSAWAGSPRAAAERTAERPLAGVRVVEIATIIAAPMGASLLADLGADVIKVEAIGGDPYRGMGAGVGSMRVNVGKRSVCLNLKDEGDQQALLRLLDDADVLIHNFRPGVPERLGLGADALAVSHPKLVYVQSNGYGPLGPGAHRPSTHPVPGAALGGVLEQVGGELPSELLDMETLQGWCRRLMRANEVNPDPNTAVVVANAALLGLAARTRTGRGQSAFVDMLGANAYANWDDFVSYAGKPARLSAGPDGLGLSATYRLYPCANAQWVFLALATEEDVAAFQRLMRAEGLLADEVLTEELFTSLLAQRSADQWEGMCLANGVACVRADRHMPHEFWLSLSDPAVAPFADSAWGRYRRPGPLVTIDGLPPLELAAPEAGAHNEALLP